MKKILTFIVIVALGVSGYLYREQIQDYATKLKDKYNNEKVLREANLLLRELPPKEIETIDLKTQSPLLTFKKTGSSTSSTQVYLTPQVTGEITSINVKVGDQVDKGETLIKLGNSLATDIANLQYEGTLDSIYLTQQSEELTGQINFNTLESGVIAGNMAKDAYLNALKAKESTEDLLDSQLEAAELSLETAEDGYEDIKDNISDTEDAIDELEDQYATLQSVQYGDYEIIEKIQQKIALDEMAQTIAQLKGQLASLKTAKKSAKTGIEQSELAIDQIKAGQESQLQQLNFAISSAQSQFKSAQNQVEIMAESGELQELGIEGQLSQLDSSLQAAKLSLQYQNVESPINGTVTEIKAEEGNLTSPGQILMKIENLNAITVKTSVNEEELQLIKVGDSVEIKNNDSKLFGVITSVNPTANAITKKFDVEIETNDNKNLNPGAFVKVIFTADTNNRTFIPLNSISLIADTKIVKTIKGDSTIEFKQVTTGQIIGDYIEVITGLNGNEKIVKTVTVPLAEGEKVALLK